MSKASRWHFRAWDPLSNPPKMVGPMDGYMFWAHMHPGCCDVTIMQSTGLTDKNGVEVFIGDIVKGIKAGRNSRRTGVVVETKRRLGFEIDTQYDTVKWLNHIEVIGNRYENEDLIQGNYRSKP